ncbi:MAG: MFS transporter [Veillonellales bacterium]
MNEKNEQVDDEKIAKKNITALGWVAFWGGLSQDMIVPILPIFYTQILGMTKETVGLIEGCLTTVVSVCKILSGMISDKVGKRKPIVFLGYLFSAIGRLLLAFSSQVGAVFGVRMLDGIGKGTKDAPRDALIAKSASMKNMGYAFGYQRMLDTLGSFVGPLVTTGLLVLFAQYGEVQKYRMVFLLAGIVAFITIVLIALLVKERSETKAAGKFVLDFSVLKGKFLWFFIIMLVFTLGNSSDAFLILRAQDVGVAPVLIPVIIAVFNLLYALLAIPCGVLSDRIGRIRVIQLGWLVYAASYLGFAVAQSAWHIWILYAVYGIYYAMTEGVAKALVAQLVDESHRGAAFGLYNASLGLMALPASALAGVLWDKVSPSAPFYFGAGLALAAAGLLFLVNFKNTAESKAL